MKPIQFDVQKSKEFYAELKVRVKEYFEKNNISDKGNRYLYSKTIILLLAWIGAYALIVSSAGSLLATIGSYVLFGLIGGLIGFNIMHDGGHGGYSDKKWLNTIMWYAMNLLWSDINFWKISHNLLHHTFTNIEGYDDDIENWPIFRFHPEQERKWFHRYQYIYWPFFYWFGLWNRIFYSDFRKYFKGNRGNHKLAKLSTKNKIAFWLTKIGLVTVYYIVPAIFVGRRQALIGFLLMYYVMSFFVMIVFQLAHVLEDTQMVAHKDHKIEENWAIHQLNTTANFAMWNRIWTRLLWGLNYQVEHHLFSHISHIHYSKISPIIQEVCKKYNITYHSYPTIQSAIISHIRYIKYLWAHD